jgi:hypothetical protein
MEWAKFQINAMDILDIHEEVPIVDNSRAPIETNLIEMFWEGLPATLGSMGLLEDFFESYSDNNFKLNILTDLNSFKYMNRFKKIDLDRVLTQQLQHSNLEINKIQWSPQMLVNYAASSKFGVIPIHAIKGYNHLKAENRLLIMWRLGLPVLTSPLMSYARVMRDAQIDGICIDHAEWKVKLGRLTFSADLRHEFIEKSRNYLETRHKTEDVLKKWDYVLGET